jgi:hypothetical protein
MGAALSLQYIFCSFMVLFQADFSLFIPYTALPAIHSFDKFLSLLWANFRFFTSFFPLFRLNKTCHHLSPYLCVTYSFLVSIFAPFLPFLEAFLMLVEKAVFW